MIGNVLIPTSSHKQRNRLAEFAIRELCDFFLIIIIIAIIIQL